MRLRNKFARLTGARMGIANSCLYLASNESMYITGSE
jgi:hypothetical protein